MRGSTWSTVKPILKALHEHFPAGAIHQALIVKPDNFWQKQRTSLGSHNAQLTSDLDGTLPYDHSSWLETRLAEDLARNDFAGQRVLQKCCAQDTGQGGSGSGGGGGGVGGLTNDNNPSAGGGGNVGGGNQTASDQSPPPSSQDLTDVRNLVLQNLEAVHSSQQHLLQLWHHKKLKLDQCFQLRLFEQDCEKMFEWICHNRDVFLLNYVEIGHTYQLAKQLQEEHQHFAMSSMNVYVNINRILSIGSSVEGLRSRPR
nr:unnamed protein product [Callosobruchus analis]